MSKDITILFKCFKNFNIILQNRYSVFYWLPDVNKTLDAICASPSRDDLCRIKPLAEVRPARRRRWALGYLRCRNKMLGTVNETIVGCQFVGLGPGGLGVLLAAERLCVLSDILGRGVALIDRLPEGRRLGASGLAYAIGSNSRGGELIAGVALEGGFAETLTSRYGWRIRAAADVPVRLPVAARFFNAVAIRACALVAEAPQGRVLTARHVASINVEPGGRVRTRGVDGATLAVSNALILSPGALSSGNGFASLCEGAFMGERQVSLSDTVLRRGGGDVVARIRAGSARRIAIAGGSHSAFSVALTLVRRGGRHLSTDAISILHRSPIRHYYSSLADARRDRVGREPLQVCAATGVINRFDGLRGEAADFSRSVQAGQEHRVRLIPISRQPEAARAAVAEADILIDATGYEAPPLTINGLDGRPLAIERTRGFPVDARNRLLGPNGKPIPGIYVTGLARRFVEPPRAAGTTIGAGAGVFQQIDGVTIARELASGFVKGFHET